MSPKPKSARSFASKPKSSASSRSATKPSSKSKSKAKPNAVAKPALRPICFVVMPYGTRDTGVAKKGVPSKVDFNALYEHVLQPAIENEGYIAVRADHELSPLIVVDMLERLTLSDLVLADLTLQNGNVYYEIGVRHATDKHNCVLVAADWAQPLFDLAQLRQGRYPLPAGALGAKEYARARKAVERAIAKYALAHSPVHQAREAARALPQASVFKDIVLQLAALQAQIRALAHVTDKAILRAQVEQLIVTHCGARGLVAASDAAALELLHAVRDRLEFTDVLAYIARLPKRLADLTYVREQRCLAQSKTGDHLGAIAGLDALIATNGDTAERRGLIGGCFKRLYDASEKSGKPHAQHLDRAIEHYERGMLLDLNSYYPGNNLPRLYRQRGASGDLERAVSVAHSVAAACQRAMQFTPSDEWLRPTLLGAAFDAADVPLARELAAKVRAEGPAAWKLDTTLKDCERSAKLCADKPTRRQLLELVEELRKLLV